MFHIYEGRLRECKWASSSPRNLFLTGAGESKFAAHGTEETAHEICNSNAGSVCFLTLGLWFFLKKIRAKKPGCSFFCSISRTVSTPNSSVAHLQDLLKTKKEKKSRNFLKKNGNGVPIQRLICSFCTPQAWGQLLCLCRVCVQQLQQG